MYVKKQLLSLVMMACVFFAGTPTKLEAMVEHPALQTLEVATALGPLFAIASSHVQDYETAKQCALWAQIFRIANESLACLQSAPLSPAAVYNGCWALRDMFLLYKMSKGHFRKKLSVLAQVEQITAESITREDIMPILEILLAGYQAYLHSQDGSLEEKNMVAGLHSWLRWLDYTIFWQSDRKTEQLKLAGLVLHTALIMYHIKAAKSA